MRCTNRLLLAASLFALLALPAHAQGDRVGQGLSREQMWPAPSADDWAKPCLIHFERTWADAVAVAKETGKPILVCINMDGEIASEHHAGIRYRQREVAELYKPYVCVIASVYRHNPRDHDDKGNRIPCPRFGGVTCGEHIWIEPIIFEKFCDGRRIAPRHIAVDLEGTEAYDVFYVNDTAGVFDAIRDGRKKLPPAKAPIVRGDRPVLERVASPAAEDRAAVEAAYKKGDAKTRRSLLEAAKKAENNDQLDLLRLAIFGLDANMSREARNALAKSKTPGAAGLVGDALSVPMDDAQRDALIATLKKLGHLSLRARWLAGVHTGLASTSSTVDVNRWAGVAGAEYPAPFGGSGGVQHVEERTAAAQERPSDPAARIELAEATLALALKAPELFVGNPRLAKLAARHSYEDAQRLAKEAEKLGATKWRVATVRALAMYYSGERQKSYEHAAIAVKELPPGDTGWSSMAVLTVFAESRWKAIQAAVKENKNWPPEWLSDLHAAHAILLRHPMGTDGQVVWHYDFLDWLGIRYRASRVLRDGLARFLDSPRLHEKLRERVLKYRGPDALEAEYDRLLNEHNDTARLGRFAGYASMVAADSHRRARRFQKAMDAYGRAIQRYEEAMAATLAKPMTEMERGAYRYNNRNSSHAIAMAHASRARVAYQLGDDETAFKEILASFKRSPISAGSRGGLGETPGETAQMLLARLRKDNKEQLAGELAAALSNLDQKLLAPDIGLQEPE
ncbi:MAG: hypothetical protein V3T86_17080 [Planctomycetota bacterium]